MRCQFLEQRQLRFMMIDPSAEAEESEDTERQRQRKCVSRIFRGMRADYRQRLGRGTFDRESDGLDMLSFADRETGAQRSGPSHCLPGFGHSCLKLQQAGVCDVRERKFRVDVDRPREALLRTSVGRQE